MKDRDRPLDLDRLERMIERLVTQRACLDFAASSIANVSGVVLEVGLGKGRTFDHLRRLFSKREFFAFDREVHAPADAVPDEQHLFLGDFRQTLEAAVYRLGCSAALIHADIGSEDKARDRALALAITPFIVQLAQPGGYVLSDRALVAKELVPQSLPQTVGNFPYFIYRVDNAPTEGRRAE
jgi:hypothetical protein